MASQTDEMRFTGASIDLLYRIKQSAYRHASDRALQRARQDGRELVTEADVLAGLRTALDEVASSELESHDVQPVERLSETVAS